MDEAESDVPVRSAKVLDNLITFLQGVFVPSLFRL